MYKYPTIRKGQYYAAFYHPILGRVLGALLFFTLPLFMLLAWATPQRWGGSTFLELWKGAPGAYVDLTRIIFARRIP